MTDYKEIYEQWQKTNSQLLCACKNHLIRTLDNQPDAKVEFDDDHYVEIAYNGGGHPEYASNCFSPVYRVYMVDAEIYFDIYETDEYPLEDVMNVADLYWVCRMLDAQIKDGFNPKPEKKN